MLRNVVECLVKQKMQINSILDNPVQNIEINGDKLRIIKSFEKFCMSGRKRSPLQIQISTFSNFVLNPKLLLGLVSGLYMFCIVFTFFLSLYYEIYVENKLDKNHEKKS